jgi:hypothetical protein
MICFVYHFFIRNTLANPFQSTELLLSKRSYFSDELIADI